MLGRGLDDTQSIVRMCFDHSPDAVQSDDIVEYLWTAHPGKFFLFSLSKTGISRVSIPINRCRWRAVSDRFFTNQYYFTGILRTLLFFVRVWLQICCCVGFHFAVTYSPYILPVIFAAQSILLFFQTYISCQIKDTLKVIEVAVVDLSHKIWSFYNTRLNTKRLYVYFLEPCP